MYLSSLKALTEELISIQSNEDIKGVLLFVAAKNQPTTSEISAVLNTNEKPLLGGVFPEIIAEGRRKEEGFLLLYLYQNIDVKAIENKSDKKELPKIMEDSFLDYPASTQSAFCFINALWSQKTAFMRALYDELGPFIDYLGGGAGSLSFTSFPCLFANKDLVEHGAVVGLSEFPISLGVAHGWQPISNLIKVTEVKGNQIISLNWRPAFEVYKELVDEHSKKQISADNFFEIAKSYPLGLVKLDDEMIIRDPYATQDNEISVIDKVPEGEYIRIMHGGMKSLLSGAEFALKQAVKDTSEPSSILCIDCISRVLFMQDEFTRELDILNQYPHTSGVLSIGEIANSGNSSLELYNKTVVVSQWKTKK